MLHSELDPMAGWISRDGRIESQAGDHAKRKPNNHALQFQDKVGIIVSVCEVRVAISPWIMKAKPAQPMPKRCRKMAQSKPERISINEILKFVDQLSAEEHEQLVDEMKLQWLRREVQRGIDQADRGELIDGHVVFEELKQRYQRQSE